MKKFKTFIILALAITFFAISCTKEGPQGPAGTANVIYSAWVKKLHLAVIMQILLYRIMRVL